MSGRRGDDTREALLRAGERLMAERGIDGVDLREIHAAAGQRNRSAIGYHFGGRDELVRAIGAKHRGPINAERNTILDRLDATGSITIAELVGALVRPLARRLDDQPGRDYIVILAEASGRLGTTGLYRAEGLHTDSVIRCVEQLDPLLTGSPAARRTRMGQAILATPVLLADLARDINRGQLTLNQAKRRIPGVIEFISGALHGIGSD
jgi:AcrR family transcriptional regulator